jgi:glycosyltransferase involved in cell wall biosynthesis
LSSNLLEWGTIIATLASIGKKKCHVVVWQEIDIYSPSSVARFIQRFFYRTFGKLMVSLVDGFVSRSTAAQAFLLTLGTRPSKLLGVIPTGVNTDTFHPLSDGQASIRNKLKIGKSNRVFACVSTLDRDRGLELLINAMREVVDEIPEAKLLIRGKGPLKATLDTLINKLNLEENVSIVQDYLTREELCALFNVSDFLVVPTLFGFLPFVALESIACGKPVVSAFKRGLKDFVIDGRTGFLVEYDVKDISRKIKFLLKNPALSKEMGQNALELCKRTCDMQLVAKRFVDLFQTLTSRPAVHQP